MISAIVCTLTIAVISPKGTTYREVCTTERASRVRTFTVKPPQAKIKEGLPQEFTIPASDR